MASTTDPADVPQSRDTTAFDRVTVEEEDVLGGPDEPGEDVLGGPDEPGEDVLRAADEPGEDVLGGPDEPGEDVLGGPDEPGEDVFGVRMLKTLTCFVALVAGIPAVAPVHPISRGAESRKR